MSAEAVAAAALGGLTIASTGIAVQAAGNLMKPFAQPRRQSRRRVTTSQRRSQTQRRVPRQRRRERRGLDVSSAIFGRR